MCTWRGCHCGDTPLDVAPKLIEAPAGPDERWQQVASHRIGHEPPTQGLVDVLVGVPARRVFDHHCLKQMGTL